MGESKHKATIAFLPYAARREKDGEGKPSNTSKHTPPCRQILTKHLAISHWVFKMGTQLMEAELPISLKYIMLDAFRHWHPFPYYTNDIDTMMQLWMTIASALPYTNDVGQSVVDTLLQMASNEELLPHIPVPAWDWLKKRPPLHPGCRGLRWGTDEGVVQMVRKLGDVGIIASYLFVVWSGRDYFFSSEFKAMSHLIKGELSGIGVVEHRADLIHRLDCVLPQLKPGSRTEQQYKEFRMVLMEMDEEAAKALAGNVPQSRRSVLSTNMRMCRISLYLYVCASSSVPVVASRPPSTPSSD